MEKEKAIRINLPDGVEFRRVEVADGCISIIYVEESVTDAVKLSEETSIDTINMSKIPTIAFCEPIPLIGGTEVYQKEGLPYWYCKIKDGRDEFMYLYFGDLTVQDILYTEDGKEREFVTEGQKTFRENVMKALKNKHYECFRWIPVYEPSMDKHGNLQYISGENVYNRFSCLGWKNALKNYSPENGSRMASITTYFLLLLRLLKDGLATIEQLADNSTEIGNYWNSKDSKHKIEKTGERQFAGLFGFVGNTYKIVNDSESDSGYSILGGFYYMYGYEDPLGDVSRNVDPDSSRHVCVGMLELTE